MSYYKTYVENINKQILEGLKKDGLQWFSEWKPQLECVNGATNTHYHGSNHLQLSFNGFADSRYFTYRQAQEKGYQVRKGSKGSPVVKFSYYDKQTKENLSYADYTALALSEPQRAGMYIKSYIVFNAEQLDGIELEERAVDNHDYSLINNIANAIGVDVIIGSGYKYPCYSHINDTVYMPNGNLFKSEKGLLATALHELSHATGGKTRLDREFGVGKHTKEYAFEELVAEMSATILCNYYGIENSVDENHIAYIKSWFKELKDDYMFFVKAFKKAEEAVEYIIAKTEGLELAPVNDTTKAESKKPYDMQSIFDEEEKPIAKPKKAKTPFKTQGEFYVAMKDGKKLVKGYVDTYLNHKFGVSKSQSGTCYTITEINSGCSVASCDKVKDAMNKLVSITEALEKYYANKAVVSKNNARLKEMKVIA